MKVALSCNNFPPEFRGGTERVVEALAQRLAAAGEEVVVFAGTEIERETAAVHRTDVGDLPVYRLPLGEGEQYSLDVARPRLLGELRQLLGDLGTEVLHVHHWSHLSDGQVRMARGLGLGCVVTLHDMWTSCPRFFRLPPGGVRCPSGDEREACVDCANRDLKEARDKVEEQISRRDAGLTRELGLAHYVVAPSEDCARACREHCRWQDTPTPIEVLPHGLLDAAHPGERGPLGLPLRVGTFGGLNQEKGVLDLVAAMRGIRAELHLFGTGRDDFRAAVEKQAAELDVRLLWHGGYDASMPHPALQLDLAVFPSRCRETYGLVVDEALHCGTPVLVSEAGALPERVSRGGGLTVPSGDVDALATAIRGLVADREAYHLLRASIPTDFPSIEDTVSRYRHLYAKAFATARTQS